MNFKKTTLKNGLTIITSPMPGSPSVTVLVMVHTGSKYETKDKNGLSHFLEHMCFKGTARRPKASDISLELDSIGSQNNAFTAQEFTGYYAKAHPKHVGKILDVVSDLYLNPIFDSKEIEKEKGVIIEEINMYEDMPHRIVHDVFMDAMYGDQPAGWNIAGTKDNVSKMTREDFLAYRDKHYVAEATTVLVAGDFDEEKMLADVEKAFADIPQKTKHPKAPIVEGETSPIIKIKAKDTDQTHIVLGLRTFDGKDDRNYILKVLNSILGGGMSSRLFQKLRDEMGVGYYVRSGTDEFTDHGFLAVSTGVDTSRVKEVVQAVLLEIKRFTSELVPEKELAKAKEYMLGNMYMGLESSDAVAEYYAMQDIISRDEIITPDQFAEKIQKVTAEEVQNLAKEIVRDDRLALAIVGNIKDESALREIFHF